VTLRDLKSAQLVLASASPRRLMLLEQVGLRPLVRPSDVEEVAPPGLEPQAQVEHLAWIKAADVAGKSPDADLVLGADTLVVQDGQILGKPRDREEAARMLGQLAGAWHTVYTGFALIQPGDRQKVVGHASSAVQFRPLTPAEIDAYLDTGESFDKAGAYGLQALGALLVAQIQGDYSNIVGLPLVSVDTAWRSLGWRVL
jgi:septum formation protein